MKEPLEPYPFQKEGIEYLVDKRSVLLGDDMGLGKSLQAVVMDQIRREKQPNLVAKPKTLVVTFLGIFSSWVEHFERQTNLRIKVIDPKDRVEFIVNLFSNSADVFIMHWQALRLMPELERMKFFHVILDECHSLQNRNSKQTIAAKKIKTIYKTGLSGTPAYDKPDDLWSILNWLYPEYWSSYWRYFNEHVLSVDNDGYKVIIGVKNVKKLQSEMHSFYLRRKKEEVLFDLPEKYYSTIMVDLNPKQRRAYDQMKKEMIAWIGEHEDEQVSAQEVIAQLCRLQQFSDAYGEIVQVTKFDKITGEEYQENHMKLAEPSSKIDAVIQLIVSTAGQVVVFSQFSQVINLLCARMDKCGITYGLFTGATSPDERTRIINEFQDGKLQVFAGTIHAGGVGITLNSCSTVMFVDRSWSPSWNLQAEDRLHRIGQRNAVQVIDVISRGTIDTKRIQKINLQWGWIKRLVGDEEIDEVDYEYDK